MGHLALFRSVLLLAIALTSLLALVADKSTVVLNGARGTGPVGTQVVAAGVAPGSCVSFAPLRGRVNKTVFLDPGHGGLDPGVVAAAAGKPVLEKDVTLAVATKLSALLRVDGYRVVMSRVADTSVGRSASSGVVAGALTTAAVHQDLLARAECANAAKASVLLSIHFNAFDDPDVGGTETYYDAVRPFARDSKKLAAALQSAVVSALGSGDRGVWTDEQLGSPALTAGGDAYGHLIELGPAARGWVDDPSAMPGALIEPLFLTNPNEATYADSPVGQDRIAAALRAGLESYFN